jgi:hypothetical protein
MSLQQSEQQSIPLSPALDEALVIGGGNENWIVQSNYGTFKAKKAVSCLVAPEIGDRVLSVNLSSGESNILAILERKQSDITKLQFEGNVDISASQSIRLLASERLDAFAGSKMNLDTNELTMRSKLSSMIFDRLNITGNEAHGGVNKVKLIAKYLETVSETSRQVMKNSFRLISGLDSVNASEILQKVKNRFTVQSRQASMLAEEDAKVNGKRVHLG